MPGLVEQAGGVSPGADRPDGPRQSWQESMLQKLEALRGDIQARRPEEVAGRCGATYQAGSVVLSYWGQQVQISWPTLDAVFLPSGAALTTFDLAMLYYYLHTADGAPMADRWISFRELPHGAFYNQAFQGYSGDRLARAFAGRPDTFHAAARALGGTWLPDLAPHAYAFQPLARLRLAAALWPGDEDFPTQAAVLFDAAASHYLVTDGLALLGSGLTSRLIQAQSQG